MNFSYIFKHISCSIKLQHNLGLIKCKLQNLTLKDIILIKYFFLLHSLSHVTLQLLSLHTCVFSVVLCKQFDILDSGHIKIGGSDNSKHKGHSKSLSLFWIDFPKNSKRFVSARTSLPPGWQGDTSSSKRILRSK